MMYIKELMKKNDMNRTDLSRESGVPDSTLRDILDGTSRIDQCKAITLMLLAQTLGVTVEDILMHSLSEDLNEYPPGKDGDTKADGKVLPNESLHVFYTFMETLKEMTGTVSDIDLCLFVRNSNWVERFFRDESYGIALFLVGFSDYVCRKYRVCTFREYEKYRHLRLKTPVYPIELFDPDADYSAFKKEKEKIETFAIPELGRMNIFMREKDLRGKV